MTFADLEITNTFVFCRPNGEPSQLTPETFEKTGFGKARADSPIGEICVSPAANVKRVAPPARVIFTMNRLIPILLIAIAAQARAGDLLTVTVPTLDCSGSACPIPTVKQSLTVADTSALTPIQAILARLVADASVLDSTTGSLSVAHSATLAAQQAEADMLARANAARAAVKQDQLDLAAAAGNDPPAPGPGPSPATHIVSLLAITSTATCAPCRALQPILDAMRAAGANIQTADGNDPAVCAKWAVDSIPVVIVLVDGSEPAQDKSITRAHGITGQKSLTVWLNDWTAWVKATYPQPTK